MQFCRRPAAQASSPTVPALLLLAIVCAFVFPAHSQDVRTYRNNNSRSGVSPTETTLTLANVNYATFGKLSLIPTDGLVDAQPLYLSAVTISGVTHNLLIVATENDSVYAFDADTSVLIWQVRALMPGETPSDHRHCNQVLPVIGITATPVIFRPPNSTPAIYVVAMSKDELGHYHQRLHALDATNGQELHNGPVEIQATYPGTGDSSSSGLVMFDPGLYKERAALLLVGTNVYTAWASHCDSRPYTGWIIGYNVATLAQTSILNLTPNGAGGAIWGSGAGMAADSDGSIYTLVGNGDFDTLLNVAGFPSGGDYGNAFLKLSTTGGLAVADYFEMFNQLTENTNDADLGSGGAVLVNAKDSSGTIHKLAVGAGKDTNLYVVDRSSLGKFNPLSNQIYQELSHALPGGIWSTPAAFNGRIYYGPQNSPILAFQFQNAKLISTPVAKTANAFPYPGASPSISTNAGQNTIVWAVENSSPAVLHAYNAQNLLELYNSNQAPSGRDQFGDGNKFITPTIAHGRVYVGTPAGVAVFGLLP